MVVSVVVGSGGNVGNVHGEVVGCVIIVDPALKIDRKAIFISQFSLKNLLFFLWLGKMFKNLIKN